MKHLKLYENFNTPYTVIDGTINVTGDGLTSLGELPEGLKILYSSNNKLTSLPELPEGLTHLMCSDNQLELLPKLPDSLERLYCGDNIITTLPKLPNNLTALAVQQNKITYLPELPESLIEFYCFDNMIEDLIPTKFLKYQTTDWLQKYYYPYVNRYNGQKIILTRKPHMVKDLIKQAEEILPEIKIEFAHLFTGDDLNLL